MKVLVQIKYLVAIRGKLYYRRRVPTDLQGRVGAKQWKHSLGLDVGQESSATKAVSKLTRLHDAEIERLRRSPAEAPGDPDEYRAQLHQKAKDLGILPEQKFDTHEPGYGSIPRSEFDDVHFDAAINRALEDGWDQSKLSEMQANGELYELLDRYWTPEEKALFHLSRTGEVPPKTDLRMNEVFSYDCRTRTLAPKAIKTNKFAADQFEALMGSPNLLSLKRRNITEFIQKLSNDRQQSASTIKRRITSLRAMVNHYYKDHELVHKNPFSNPAIPNASGRVEDRLPFHKNHMALIDKYLENSKVTDQTKQIIALLRFTGAGQSEIAEMQVTDVFLEHPVPHIWIRPNDLRERLKVQAKEGADSVRERRIPLVGPALEAAKEAVAGRTEGILFPSPQNPDRLNERGALSKRLNKVLKEAGIPGSRRLVVYSFRHTLKEALSSCGAPEEVVQRINGHSGEGTSSKYGAVEGKLTVHKKWLESALQVLGDIEATNYRTDEWVD